MKKKIIPIMFRLVLIVFIGLTIIFIFRYDLIRIYLSQKYKVEVNFVMDFMSRVVSNGDNEKTNRLLSNDSLFIREGFIDKFQEVLNEFDINEAKVRYVNEGIIEGKEIRHIMIYFMNNENLNIDFMIMKNGEWGMYSMMLSYDIYYLMQKKGIFNAHIIP